MGDKSIRKHGTCIYIYVCVHRNDARAAIYVPTPTRPCHRPSSRDGAQAFVDTKPTDLYLIHYYNFNIIIYHNIYMYNNICNEYYNIDIYFYTNHKNNTRRQSSEDFIE